MRYGFIGLGNLGKHLAANLARGGFHVGVYDLQRSAADAALGAGAHWVDSIPELAKTSDCLITCLPSPAATTAVLDLALPAMRRGSTWIEMSTNDFAEVEALAARAEGLGIATLACPVTGGVHRASEGLDNLSQYWHSSPGELDRGRTDAEARRLTGGTMPILA